MPCAGCERLGRPAAAEFEQAILQAAERFRERGLRPAIIEKATPESKRPPFA